MKKLLFLVNNDYNVEHISYVFRGDNITGAGDEKLLNLKYAWCLHQVSNNRPK